MSTNHFNQLTEAELERLAGLVEECGEVIQIVGKIVKHGYASHNPKDPERTINRLLLEKELGDLMFSIAQMDDHGDIEGNHIFDFADAKADSIQQYYHHQPSPVFRQGEKE